MQYLYKCPPKDSCNSHDAFDHLRWSRVRLQHLNPDFITHNSIPAAPQDLRHIVISGPSGAGKGTLIQKLLDAHPNTFGLTVSHTTRKPRPGEVNAVDYFFVSPSDFSSLLSQGALVEHACFSGKHYGTSKQTINEQASKGLVVVLDIEIQCVKQMKANPSIDTRYVFIKPPSFGALGARLRGRGTENEEEIQQARTG